MKCSTLRILWTAVLAVALVSTACGDDDPSSSDETCVVKSDCAANEICGSDGTCVEVGEEGCSEDSECTEIPDPTCTGDELITYGGVCDGAEFQTCKYPAVGTVTCPTGCSEGACNPNPCEDVVCDDPPAPMCDQNDGLVTYEDTGTCSAGECTYPQVSPGQSCVHGCDEGACVPGPCEQDACDSPPPNRCDGNTGVSYASTGTCTEEDGSATCSYDITFENCDYVGGTCDAGTGTCTDPITQAGGAAIVEYMANPASLWDGNSEWFEVVNTSGADIDLTGWKIVSADGDGIEEHVLVTPPTFAAGQRLLFANGDDPAGDASITPDYVYSTITLTNTIDWIQLVNASDEIVDYVFWEAGSVMEGKSRKLSPGVTDKVTGNDDFANWCPEIVADFGTGDNLGTPGEINPACSSDVCANVTCERPDDFCNADGNAVQYQVDTATCETTRFNNPFCDFEPAETDCTDAEYCLSGVCETVSGQLPVAGDVVFTEFMGNPTGTDADKEYLELYNTTDQELTLFTLTIKDNETGGSSDSFVVEDPAATIPAKGYAVFVANTDDTANGGITGGYELADSPLKNSPGAGGLVISLTLRDGTVIDDAYYGAPTEGVAQQLSLDAYTGSATNIAASNDADANFCAATVADAGYTSGDLGSPGADNETCIAP